MKRTVLSTAQASKATQMHGYLQTQSGGKKRFEEEKKKETSVSFSFDIVDFGKVNKKTYVIPPKTGKSKWQVFANSADVNLEFVRNELNEKLIPFHYVLHADTTKLHRFHKEVQLPRYKIQRLQSSGWLNFVSFLFL